MAVETWSPKNGLSNCTRPVARLFHPHLPGPQGTQGLAQCAGDPIRRARPDQPFGGGGSERADRRPRGTDHHRGGRRPLRHFCDTATPARAASPLPPRRIKRYPDRFPHVQQDL